MPGPMFHFSEQERSLLLQDAGFAARKDRPDEAIAYLMTPGFTCPRDTIARGEMLRGLLPAVMRLPSRPEAEQRTWDRILDIVRSSETITLADDGVRAVIGTAVHSGLLTATEALRITHRECNLIESLIGRNVPFLTAADIEFNFGTEVVNV